MLILAKLFALIVFLAIVTLVWAYLRTPPAEGDQIWPEDDYFD